MRMRQEQVVLLATVALLALMSWALVSGETERRSRRTGTDLELEQFAPPDVARVIPDPEITPKLRRELFAPPRDTRPLPPLDLVEPPRRPLARLLPPAEPGPAPEAYGRVLRRDIEVTDGPDLFADAEGEAGFEDTAFEDVEGDGEDASAVRDLLRQAAEDDSPFEDETPAEREARFAGYRGRYDWIQRAIGEMEFGHAMLAGSKKFTRASQFQVSFCNFKSILSLFKSSYTFPRIF